MKIVLTLVIVALVAGLAGLAVLYSGVYNVAASEPHNKLTLRLLEIFIDRSVAFHARGIVAPLLDQPGQVQAGAGHYDSMCAECHGGPGAKRDEFSYGMYPAPPELRQPAAEFSAAELFWITRNGLKMSGMPAFSASHEDEQIWALVAFARRLPTMTPAEYAELTRNARGEGEGHDQKQEYETGETGEATAAPAGGQAGSGESLGV